MNERIEAGYREAFRRLLARVRPRRLDFGVELLLGRARARADRERTPLPGALHELYLETRDRVDRRVALMRACAVEEAALAGPALFLCDESLGGLARWLWAAGQQADVGRGLRGDALLREAARRGAVLLTSDASLLQRRGVRDGSRPLSWVPTGLSLLEQLDWVRGERGLRLGPPRCMACGGELQAAEKGRVRERIPPRTALWKDEYWTCGRCGRLFWQGTHWQRIAARLAELPAA